MALVPWHHVSLLQPVRVPIQPRITHYQHHQRYTRNPMAAGKENGLIPLHELDSQLHLLNIWSQDSWLDFDTAWMRIRDTYFRCTCDPSSWLYQNRRQGDPYMQYYYDTMYGIQQGD